MTRTGNILEVSRFGSPRLLAERARQPAATLNSQGAVTGWRSHTTCLGAQPCRVRHGDESYGPPPQNTLAGRDSP
ncbi:hypothetical protein Mal4_51570 [Maioricimonas rarisocia]|uniref:Uncharacterized protein n=1 Tax=Maioricimonas rarisocia TaxID=2528026 RepID=A0A517ZE89_9PLAN|nr:hypothetical protein Mal4_51570 [Maioricimonas rarisocia]